MSDDSPDAWAISIATLQLANRLIDAIQEGVRGAGHLDVRPVHGFAFIHIAAGAATVASLGEHLGVSKQAAAQLVDRLVRAGYVQRRPHPSDQRSQLLELTPAGRAVTQVAQRTAMATVAAWRTELDPHDRLAFERSLLTLTAGYDTVRPTW
jgi:DNA-binding MarR family transcriptional regulator